MKKSLLLIAAALMLCACNFNINNIKVGSGRVVICNGEVVERNMDLSGFDEVLLQGAAKVVYSQNEEFLVSVKANEEVFKYLDYEVNGDKLVLATKDGVNIKAKTYIVTVNAPLLKDINVMGAADLDMTKGYTSTEPLHIAVNGAGDMDLAGIEVPSMSITINGAGDLEIDKATASDISVTVNGAGDLDLDNLDAESVSVTVRGAGDVQLSGKTNQADFHVSGAGSVDARALKCENVTTAKHGAASIRL